MDRNWHIRGGRVVDPAANIDRQADIHIRDGKIVGSTESRDDAIVIDADGLCVMPGFLDLHVHLREPGREAAETIETGARAAARGGFSRIVAMPNTTPPVDTPERVAYQIEKGREAGYARVLPSACITTGRAGSGIADLAALKEAGAVAFTDDGATVPSRDVLEEAMQEAARLGVIVMDHALDPDLAGNGAIHEGSASRALGVPGIPAAAELTIAKRDIELAARTRCRMHIQHASCEGTVDMIARARAEGMPVSGEATPHHLALCDTDIPNGDPNYKMNPPLCEQSDRAALLKGVADGTIEALATDHAPHLAEEKARGIQDAPFGIIGLETAIGVTYTELVKSGMMSVLDWVDRWTVGPARLLGLPTPTLAAGSPANVTIADLSSNWHVTLDDFSSKSRNSPFIGRQLVGRCLYTWTEGRLTWGEGLGG